MKSTNSNMHRRKNNIRKPKPKTSSLMHDRQRERVHMEGLGVFKDIAKWLNKAAKDTKIISRAGPIVGDLVGLAFPQAGKVISSASKFAGKHGYGYDLSGRGKVKSISAAQLQALKNGHGKLLKSGSISLSAAKNKNIKNITAAQWKAVQQMRGRKMKGGGINFPAGGGIKLAGEGKKKRRKKGGKILQVRRRLQS